MSEEEQDQWTPEVEYYLLPGRQVGRITYDAEANEYYESEIMDSTGRWRAVPAGNILSTGRRISRKEAKKWVKKLGGRLRR